MPITTPTQLVDEFKKSGEFDRLRRELLLKFQQSVQDGDFKAQIEAIATKAMNDSRNKYISSDQLHHELMQEVDRFPVVDGATSAVATFDPLFEDGLKASIQKVLREDRERSNPEANLPTVSAPSEAASEPKSTTDPSTATSTTVV
ncbi:hypothetical protein C8J56DRAFT_935514 [Mycena floridula]|nr:hypothetical protein C8J56DRAFT_935514 [Mycena floridula]